MGSVVTVNSGRETLSKEQAEMLHPREGVFLQCDRFEIEPPKKGSGITSGLSHLFGYSGKNCLFVKPVWALS